MTFVVPPGSVLVTSPLLLVMQQYGVLIPLGGPPVGLGSFCSGSWTSRLWGKVGGFVWGVGEYRYCVGIARDRACARAQTFEIENMRAHVACGVFVTNTRERAREQECREEEMFAHTTPLLSIDVHFYDSDDGTAQRTAHLHTSTPPHLHTSTL